MLRIAIGFAVVVGSLLWPRGPAAAQRGTLGYSGTDVSFQGVARVIGGPIMITTRTGARYELTSAADGVAFDIDGDGSLEQVAWTVPGSEVAFLAMDRDGDGAITSGRELFGNRTLPGVTNGFDALARLSQASNGGVMRGSVSQDDPLFAQLLLWIDVNHNGISEASELRPAGELLSDIGLGYNLTNRKDEHGNLFRSLGWAAERTEPGRNRARTKEEEDARHIPIWDVYLKVAGPAIH